MTHYQLVSSNKTKSWLVIFGFIAFIVAISYFIVIGSDSNPSIILIALAISSFSSLGSYYFSDKIVLGISGAKLASRKKYFDFYTVAENLSLGQRLPMPKLYVIKDTAINAFATGRDPEHAVICVTTGLLKRLNRAEIEGVIAHEFSHIKNYDIRLMSLVTVLVGTIALLSDWILRMTMWKKGNRNSKSNQFVLLFFTLGIVLALLSPLIAKLIQLSISRKREFLADSTGVSMTKNPQGLIKALKKISKDKEPLEAANKATAHLYIANPLKNTHGAIGMFSKMFATHPPVKERLKALQQLV